MSLNSVVSAERLHIGFFGQRNAGKSSVVNAVTGQELAVVSDVKGTTTDPVKKAMELLPLGPVVIIDTPGLDDEGNLGRLRVQKAKLVLAQTDIAVLVVDSTKGLLPEDTQLIEHFKQKGLPYIIAYNKLDLIKEKKELKENEIYVSAQTKENIFELKEMLGNFAKNIKNEKHIVSDNLNKGDIVILVIPIDSSAPKGRLILPQQQTIRDILDAHCTTIACQEQELELTLSELKVQPKLVITDSQAFEYVAKVVPQNIMLASFSILFANYKGMLVELVKGAAKLNQLEDGDVILISEGCTHHRQCNDIGTVKFPGWIEKYTGKKLNYEFSSGLEFPEDLKKYSLIIHCGGCMLNEKEMHSRIEKAKQQGVAITNYGIAISQIHGILKRTLQIFPHILELLN
ncbi:MAG: [FeFe] hydrogenase H-cluster maturation GTPase HydF [Oscillospiraceae bacterium]